MAKTRPCCFLSECPVPEREVIWPIASNCYCANPLRAALQIPRILEDAQNDDDIRPENMARM